jgi:hypothetical protein
VDADARIGRPRATRHEGDAGPPGHRAVGTGHEADPAFLPAGDEIDLRRVVQRVEYGEEALARNVKDAVAALRHEIVDKDAAAGAKFGHVRLPTVARAKRKKGRASSCPRGPFLL